jgi:Na+/H+-dicarboxylate symporters
MAFSTTLLFGDSATALSIVQTLSSVALQIGSLIFIPMLFVGVASGVASLRRHELGNKVHLTGIFWIVFTSILLPVLAVCAFSIHPVMFPVTSSAGASSVSSYVLNAAKGVTGTAFGGNPFYTMAITSTFLLPLLVIAWLVGYALKPNVKVIIPAYVGFNSFSEVIFRISHYFTTFGYFLTYILATNLFLSLYNEKTIFVSAPFLITILVITALLVLVILPIIYLIITRQNPYKLLYRCLAALISAVAGGNPNYTSPMIETLARHNLGVQKRIGATLTPVFAVFSKAGSATMAALAMASIMYSATGEIPALSILLVVALYSTLAGFGACTSVGYEVPFILFAVMKMCNISFYGAEMTLFGILPLFTGLGYLIDTEIALMGLAIAGKFTKTSCPTLYGDIL